MYILIQFIEVYIEKGYLLRIILMFLCFVVLDPSLCVVAKVLPHRAGRMKGE